MRHRSFLPAAGMVLALSMVSACATANAESLTSEAEAMADSSADHVFVWIEIQAAEGMEDTIRETFVEVIKTTHKPGILRAEIFEDTKIPGKFHSIQEWESEAAFDAHMSGSSEGLDDNMAMLRGMPGLTILKYLGSQEWPEEVHD